MKWIIKQQAWARYLLLIVIVPMLILGFLLTLLGASLKALGLYMFLDPSGARQEIREIKRSLSVYTK